MPRYERAHKVFMFRRFASFHPNADPTQRPLKCKSHGFCQEIRARDGDLGSGLLHRITFHFVTDPCESSRTAKRSLCCRWATIYDVYEQRSGKYFQILASTVEDFTNYVLKRIQTKRNEFSVNPRVMTINYCVL